MPESTLSLTFDNYLSEVGFTLGWGKGANAGDTAWTARRQADLVGIVKSGLRNAYWPVPVGNQPSYEWSFLRPSFSVSMPSGESEVDLPSDFRSFEGTFLPVSDGTNNFLQVRVHDESQVTYAFSREPDRTGRPWMVAAKLLRGTTMTAGTRYRLALFPVADADYTLAFKYNLLPDALTSTHPYHYGGAMHAEMFLESCLAVSEVRLDDNPNGPHKQAFMERLAASISLDRSTKAQFLGMNNDHSDRPTLGRYRQNTTITYNGTTP